MAGRTFAPSAARTASGDTGVIAGFGTDTTLRAQLDVTVFTVAAGNTLDVVLEDTLDGAKWNVIGTFTQATAITRQVVNVTTPFADRLRARWTVAGTPAPTFSVNVYSE